MYVLEPNKAREKDRERERDASKRWCERHTISRGECASTRSMKRVVGVRHGR